MKTNLLNKSVILSVLVLSACNQNPFPQGGITEVTKPATHEVAPPYTLEGPTNITCEEAKPCTATLIGHVPAPGNAILEFTNLPAGATYNATTHELSYTPDYSVVDVSADPTHTSKLFPIIGVQIKNDANPNITGSATIALTVMNTARPMTVTYASGATSVAEGTPIDQVVNVASLDFPNGPFYLSLDGAPAGTTVTSVAGTPGQFKIHFQSDGSFVTVADTASGSGFVKRFTVKYNALSLLGSSGTISKDWTISDARQGALITAPDAITQGLNVNFAIRADDMNFEIAPVITVDATNVPFGTVTVTPVVQTTSVGVSPYTSVVNVQWDGLPASAIGTTTPIFFVVCVQSARNLNTYCAAKKTLVTVAASRIVTVNDL